MWHCLLGVPTGVSLSWDLWSDSVWQENCSMLIRFIIRCGYIVYLKHLICGCLLLVLRAQFCAVLTELHLCVADVALSEVCWGSSDKCHDFTLSKTAYIHWQLDFSVSSVSSQGNIILCRSFTQCHLFSVILWGCPLDIDQTFTFMHLADAFTRALVFIKDKSVKQQITMFEFP